MNRVDATVAAAVVVKVETDPDVVDAYLEDAAHYPGGRAAGVVKPHSVEEVAACVRQARQVLPVGARSSLTGGATPAGDIILSTERLTGITATTDRVVAGAGVSLQVLQEALARHHRWLPSVPTYLGATVGGSVATNAAGAATFKYGATRAWVESLTVVLAIGDVLHIRRGEITASDEGTFLIGTSGGVRPVQVPALRMPDVAKRSAGYHAAPGMDLVDLFIGSEGTLGVIVEVEFRVNARPAGACWLLAPMPTEQRAIELTADFRAAAQETWRTRDARGIDIAAIEHIDRRSLEIIREDGVDRRLGLALPADTDVVLLAQVELSRDVAARDHWSDLAAGRGPEAPESPLTRLCQLLDAHGVIDACEIALPDDRRRASAWIELREAVPAGVNRRVAQARARDGRIHKTAGDMIVPYEHFAAMMTACRRQCEEATLDLAVWGHISDANVHPNVIPRTYGDVERGRAMLLALAGQVIAMGGCPLAEHGVGRNPVKQQMLRMLYGNEGVDAMRRVKLSLDPEWKLAPGVLFHKGVGSM